MVADRGTYLLVGGLARIIQIVCFCELYVFKNKHKTAEPRLLYLVYLSVDVYAMQTFDA